jgi:N-acetylglucosamine-6-phosphate deacetylase
MPKRFTPAHLLKDRGGTVPKKDCEEASMTAERTDISKMIDHTLLKASAEQADIRKLCAEARTHGFASVCVNSCYAKLAVEELEGTDVFARVMKENGILPSIAHTGAIAAQANAAFEMGFSHITHFYSATTTGQKINGICYSGVNEATYLNDDITVELIGDGCHIPREHMLLPYRIKGADKMALITDAMRAAGTDHVHSVLGRREDGVAVVVKDGGLLFHNNRGVMCLCAKSASEVMGHIHAVATLVIQNDTISSGGHSAIHTQGRCHRGNDAVIAV